MKINLLIISVLLSFGALSTAQATPFNGYIVKLKSGSNRLSQKLISNFGDVTKVAETSFGIFVRLETKRGLGTEALDILSRSPEIEYIEPNYIITLRNRKGGDEVSTPKDPSFTHQWGLKNTGDVGDINIPATAEEDMNILRAWSITKGSKEIKIGVIDTGVDYTHPDLKDQMDVNLAELQGKPGVDDDGNGFIDDIYGYNFAGKNGNPMDGGGHGTHCAGIIGASHNDLGIAGVMASVKIVAIKFLTDEGSGETIDAISSIDYAIKRGVRILSNSWAGNERAQSLEDSIKAANLAGITFVAAAGNEADNNDMTGSFPANFEVENVISVGSYSPMGFRSSFSNYGLRSVHVMAPGSYIVSTYPGGGNKTMSGTSMATPHIAGVVGLLLSTEPNLTPIQIRERLIKTSVRTLRLEKASRSGGRVDAYRALINQ